MAKKVAVKKQGWVIDESEGYALADTLPDDPTTFFVKDKKGKMITFKESQIFAVNPPELDGVPDNTQLTHLNEAAVLHNLRVRYRNGDIYTYTGYILIAINPYKSVPLYSDELVQKYRGKAIGRLPPHVYAVADRAYRSMKADKTSQSILISGESGAGKTETSKIVMQYLVKVGGNKSGNVNERRIIESNPILEAFGNAKTLRNNNSSRFGKFIEIHFDSQAQVVGAHIVTYLLEKSRLVYQNKGERNYHVFYQLLAGASKEMKAKLSLDSPDKFYYLSQSGCVSVPGINDATEFEIVKKAMAGVGFTSQESDDVFSTVAGVLHLGNICYTPTSGGEASTIDGEASRKALQAAARCFSVDESILLKRLTTRIVSTRRGQGKSGSSYEVPLKVQEAIYSRDALAKTVYERLFLLIVRKINESFSFDQSQSEWYIGILDIFGFEYFQNNSFEQFCINYANEKLQQHFNEQLFIQERDIYKQEGIKIPKIEYTDNQDCLDMIEKKGVGIISILDEECRLSKATDATFANRVHKTYAQHPKLKAPTISMSAGSSRVTKDEAFIVKHYAGEVCYLTAGFRDKNNDNLHPDFLLLMKSSSNGTIQSLFDESATGESSQASNARSVGSLFSKQLNELIDNLNSTVCHFIRCIKPNEQQKPAIFEGGMILTQLRCNGMLDVLQLMHAGYPTRCPYDDLYLRFKQMLPASVAKLDPPYFCEALLMVLECPSSDFALGLTKIFFRSGKLGFLEELKGEGKELPKDVVIKITRWINRKRLKRAMWSARAYYKLSRRLQSMRALKKIMKYAAIVWRITRSLFRMAKKIKRNRMVVIIQSALKMYPHRKRFLRQRSAAILLQRIIRGYLARKEWVPKIKEYKESSLRKEMEVKRRQEELKRLKEKEEEDARQREKRRQEMEEKLRKEREAELRRIEEEERLMAEAKRKAEEEEAERLRAEQIRKRREYEEQMKEEKRKKELEEFQSTIQAQETLIKNLQENLSSRAVVSDQELDDLRAQNRTLKSEVEVLRDSVSGLTQENQVLQSRLMNSEADTALAQNRLSSIESQHQSQIQKLKIENKKLSVEAASLSERLDTAKRMKDVALAKADEDILELEELLEQMTSERDELQRKLDEQLDSQRRELDDAAGRSLILEVDVKSLQNKVAVLEEMNRKLNTQCLYVEDQLVEEQKRNTNLLSIIQERTTHDRKQKKELQDKVIQLKKLVQEAKRTSTAESLVSLEHMASLIESDHAQSISQSVDEEMVQVREVSKAEEKRFLDAFSKVFKERETTVFLKNTQREEAILQLEQVNRALQEESNRLSQRVHELESQIHNIQGERQMVDHEDTSRHIELLEAENKQLVEIQKVLNSRLASLEKENEMFKRQKADAVQVIRQEIEDEKRSKEALQLELDKLKTLSDEIAEKREQRIKLYIEQAKKMEAKLDQKDKTIESANSKIQDLTKQARSLEEEMKLSVSKQNVPAVDVVDHDRDHRSMIISMFEALQAASLQSIGQQNSDLARFSDLVIQSNGRIEGLMKKATQFRASVNLSSENQRLHTFFIDMAHNMRELNDFRESALLSAVQQSEIGGVTLAVPSPNLTSSGPSPRPHKTSLFKSK